MSEFPSPSLIATIQELILRRFDVSSDMARDHAFGLAALAEGWGSPDTAPGLDWAYRVKKDLGEKLPWRSNLEREKFRSDQQDRIKAYQAFLPRDLRA